MDGIKKKMRMKTHLVKVIPAFLRPSLRKIYHVPMDLLDQFKHRNSMIPPKSMMFVGTTDFEATGQEFRKYFIELGALQPDERVLEVGCGIGRMAIPLTDYLSAKGDYWGFDIVKMGITWCQKRISPKFRNFHFIHTDIKNDSYNPAGRIAARDFRFPFENGTFDFVFLTSVFTHMLPADMHQYLSEIARVLKNGGRCLITFFLLNEDSRRLIAEGRSSLEFKYEIDGCLILEEDKPEASVAYDEAYVLRLFSDCKLRILSPIHYGAWCNRQKTLSYQDIIIARKEISD